MHYPLYGRSIDCMTRAELPPPAPDFATGERVNWVGTQHSFSKPVVIAAARFEHYVALNIPDGWRYDIADPVTGKILLYAATASELATP